MLFDTVPAGNCSIFPFMLMSYLLFNPARKLLKDRQDQDQVRLRYGHRRQKNAAALKAEYEAKLKDIDKEAEEILTEARQKAFKNQNTDCG